MPEGKLWTRAFLFTILSTLVMFAGFYLLVPTLPLYAREIGASDARIGLIVGAFTAATIPTRYLLGRRLDRIGRKGILVGGLVIFSLAAVLYGFATTFNRLLLARMIHGIGWAGATTAAGTLAGDLAPAHRRGEALGYFGLAPTVAMMVGPFAGSMLMSWQGFAAVVWGTAIMGIIASLLAARINEPPPSPPAPAGRSSPRTSSQASPIPREVLVPAIVAFLSSLSYGAVITYLPLRAAEIGVSVGSFFGVYALALLIIRPLAGRLSDVRSRSWVIIPGLALTAVAMITLGRAESTTPVLITAIIYAFGFGASFPALMALSIDLAQPEKRGAAVAFFMNSLDLGIASGAVLLGFVFERKGFATLTLVAALSALIGLTLFLAAKRHPGLVAVAGSRPDENGTPRKGPIR